MKTQKKIMLLIISVFLVSCEKNDVKQDNKISNKTSNPSSEISKSEDFEVFRKKFYSDSIFQMSRIVFPLEGDCNFCYNEIDILNQKDTNTVYFFIKDHILYWKKDTWEFISEFKDKEFQSEEGMYRTSTTGDGKKKIERIKNIDVYYNDGYYLEYKLIDNIWYLTQLHVYSY